MVLARVNAVDYACTRVFGFVTIHVYKKCVVPFFLTRLSDICIVAYLRFGLHDRVTGRFTQVYLLVSLGGVCISVITYQSKKTISCMFHCSEMLIFVYLTLFVIATTSNKVKKRI